MEQGMIGLGEAGVVENDVEQRIRTTGIRGLDFARARELGFFSRISYLLCAVHASIMAAYRIYGGVATMLNDFGGRKNEIAREMNTFERAFMKFVAFWTDYYASGESGKDVNDDTEMLYRRIMEWAQLPFEWRLGDKQRVDDVGLDVAIRVNVGDKEYTFKSTDVEEEVLECGNETWCVNKYDVTEHRLLTVENDMDKASAMMVAKRLSADDEKNIYTASIIQNVTIRKTTVTPFKAYKANDTVGRLMNIQK